MDQLPQYEAAGIDNQTRILARCQVETVSMSCAMLAPKYAEPDGVHPELNAGAPPPPGVAAIRPI